MTKAVAYCTLEGMSKGVIKMGVLPPPGAAILATGPRRRTYDEAKLAARFDGLRWHVPGVAEAENKAAAHRAIADYLTVLESRRT
jgi:hypothetical protein